MEAWVVRLSQLDDEAGGAMRVVMFYDTLMRRRVGLPALARASAGFAECVVGIKLFSTGHAVRMRPDGRELTLGDPVPSTSAPILLDEEKIGTVWLERPRLAGPYDMLLLDRLAIAVTTAVERYGPASTTMADPALVELVVSGGTDEAARARALRLLGFSPGLPVRVVAVRTGLPLDQVGRLICGNRPVKAAPLTGTGVILATTVALDAFPDGVLAGIGAAGNPAQSWRQACVALRFAGPREPVVEHAKLGALALLADLPGTALRDNPDVAAIGRLTAADLDTLDAYCAAGSQRRAADLLHLHHSSVARRLEQIGALLGFELADPSGALRARLALMAWRLAA